MALRKEDLLFKKVFAKKSITEAAADRPFFSEPYTAALSLESPNIWTETDKLPLVAPSEWVSAASYTADDVVVYTTDSSNALNLCYQAITTHNGQTGTPAADTTNWKVFTQLKWASTITMAAVTGAPYAFQDDDLKDTVPFSFGTSGYGYTFKKSGGSQISFGDKNWTFDTEAGAIYFHDDSLPSSIGTPSMTCFVYTGGKINTFISTGQIGIGTNAPTELLHIAGSSDPTLVIQSTNGNDANSGKIAFKESSNTVERMALRYDGSANKFIMDTEEIANAFVMDRVTGDVTLSGDLTVNGTTTTINSTTLTVDDKNIEMGSVATPTDTTADGGGITLKGTTDKTINWTNSDDSWHYNQHIMVETGSKIQFRDDALYIGSPSDGNLELVSDSRIKLSAPNLEVEFNTDLLDFGTGNGASITMSFNTVNNDGRIDWHDTLDTFLFDNDIRMSDANKLNFREDVTYMNSTATGIWQLVVDDYSGFTKQGVDGDSIWQWALENDNDATQIIMQLSDGAFISGTGGDGHCELRLAGASATADVFLSYGDSVLESDRIWGVGMSSDFNYIIWNEIISENALVIGTADNDITLPNSDQKLIFKHEDIWISSDGTIVSWNNEIPSSTSHTIIYNKSSAGSSTSDATITLGGGNYSNTITMSAADVYISHLQEEGEVELTKKVKLYDVFFSSGSSSADDVDYGLIEDMEGESSNNNMDNASTYATKTQALVVDDVMEFNSQEAQSDGSSTIAYHQDFRCSTNMSKPPQNIAFIGDPNVVNAASPNSGDCLFNYSMLGFTTHMKQIPRKMETIRQAVFERGEYGYWYDGGLH